MHIMARLAAEDWQNGLPGLAEFSAIGIKDSILIIVAPGQFAAFGLLVLGLLDVAYKLVESLQVHAFGVFANFVHVNTVFAHMNILPTKNPFSSLVTLNQSQNKSAILNTRNDGILNSTFYPTAGNIPDAGWIQDSRDDKLRIHYRRLGSSFEDVDLWTAFLTAMAMSAVPDKGKYGASIGTKFRHVLH